MNVWGQMTAVVLLSVGMLSACAEEPAEVGAPPTEPSIHINQVALESVGPKVAVVELPEGQAATGFTVLADDNIIMEGELETFPAFSEWGAGRQYYKADFSTVTAEGTYRIRVKTPVGDLVSAPVIVAGNAAINTVLDSMLSYFDSQRHTGEADRNIRIYDTDRYVDVYGGWKDAGGETGKYLSHLSYANFMNPQQGAITPWMFAKIYEKIPTILKEHGVAERVLDNVMWGADFMSRSVDPEGYLYMTVFDKWGTPGAERVITGYIGLDGVYTENFKASFREGGGMLIAALARAAKLSMETGVHGDYTADRYLADAERAFAHLQEFGPSYCDDGRENIIDDYTALIAASELYRATQKPVYLEAARARADNLNNRITDQGWFISDDADRPYFHGAEAGMPIVALADYVKLETGEMRSAITKATIKRALDFQLTLNEKVANPFAYARQVFKTYDFDQKVRGTELKEGFFMPHANETGYWWQGENARLSSLAVAAIEGGRLVAGNEGGAFGVSPELAAFAQHQLDWTLGRNPYDVSMLTGFGVKNPPYSESGGPLEKGGIANGITGHHQSAEGRGISFVAGPEHNNWRWAEQWLPHGTWFLLAIATMAE